MIFPKKYFEGALDVTKFSFATVGLIIYKKNKPIPQLKSLISNFIYGFCFLLLSLTVVGEFTYMLKSLSLNFLAVTNVAPCICYCVIGLVKLWAVSSKLEKSEKLLNELEDMWPTSELDEAQNEVVVDYLGKSKRAKYLITSTNIMFIWTFNTSSFIILLYHYFDKGEIVKGLPYYIYFPFDATGTIIYPFAYMFHLAAGHIANIGTIGPDNFFVATTFQICMQFKLLSWKIKNLVEEAVPLEQHFNINIGHNYHQAMYDKLITCIKLHSELIT